MHSVDDTLSMDFGATCPVKKQQRAARKRRGTIAPQKGKETHDRTNQDTAAARVQPRVDMAIPSREQCRTKRNDSPQWQTTTGINKNKGKGTAYKRGQQSNYRLPPKHSWHAGPMLRKRSSPPASSCRTPPHKPVRMATRPPSALLEQSSGPLLWPPVSSSALGQDPLQRTVMQQKGAKREKT